MCFEHPGTAIIMMAHNTYWWKTAPPSVENTTTATMQISDSSPRPPSDFRLDFVLDDFADDGLLVKRMHLQMQPMQGQKEGGHILICHNNMCASAACVLYFYLLDLPRVFPCCCLAVNDMHIFICEF